MPGNHALLAFFRGEPAVEVIRSLLHKAAVHVLPSHGTSLFKQYRGDRVFEFPNDGNGAIAFRADQVLGGAEEKERSRFVIDTLLQPCEEEHGVTSFGEFQ